MKNNNIGYLFIVLNILCIYVLYNTFISFKYQLILREDSRNKVFTLTQEQAESFPIFPNISITTLPIISQLAKYYLNSGQFSKGIQMLNEGAKINPHIYYSDYILGVYYLEIKQIDSAYSHAKKALYGWPKNIDHYNLFNKILSIRKDTTEILDTFDYINSVFTTKELHQQSFIDSYSNAKLGYLIFKYPDENPVIKDSLKGKWQQIYEFETGEISKLNNTITFDEAIFTSSDGNRYNYTINKDTLNLFFITNNKLISQIPIYFSDSLNTLILKNIPRSVIEDNPERQDQFFKKLK